MRWRFRSKKETDIKSSPDPKTDKGQSMTRVFLGGFLEGFSSGSLLFAANHPGISDRLFIPEADEEASTVVSPDTECWPQQ
jgi:hypothetical protein